MEFNPPPIEHINDVLPYIKDKPEFVVIERDWYKVIDYVYQDRNSFDNPFAYECRGLKFCSKTGKLLARPYAKFFNLDEKPETSTANVNMNSPHVILDKLDGSMVHTCESALGIYLMTRKGHTEVAKRAERIMEANPIKFSRLFSALPTSDYTHIFEYVGPENKIVLDYKESELILTAIRHNRNGTYVFHDELVKLGKALGVKVVDIYPVDKDNLLKVYEDTDKEGVVVRFDTGFMLKVKADAYVRKHRSKDLVSSPKDLLKLILDNTLDDVLPQLDDETRKDLVEYSDDLKRDIFAAAEYYKDVVKARTAMTQKEFALSIQTVFKAGAELSILFNIRKGDNALEAVKDRIYRNLSTNAKANAILSELDLPSRSFNFFGDE